MPTPFCGLHWCACTCINHYRVGLGFPLPSGHATHYLFFPPHRCLHHLVRPQVSCFPLSSEETCYASSLLDGLVCLFCLIAVTCPPVGMVLLFLACPHTLFGFCFKWVPRRTALSNNKCILVLEHVVDSHCTVAPASRHSWIVLGRAYQNFW